MPAYEPETVKGFPEFLPPESQKLEKVRRIVQDKFETYGFLPIRTPTVEFDELMRPDVLAQADEDEAISDRFHLQDKGGRNLGLRYEFTFQLARIFKQNPTIKLPFRRYQIGSIFRDEPTSAGRYREFMQCDADIIGDKGVEADAECLVLGADILKSLNIDAEVHINSRKLVNAIIESVQIENKKAIMRELDKLDKIGEDTVKANLKKYADSNQVLTLFKLLEKDLDFFVKNLFEGAEELKHIETRARIQGVRAVFSPFLMRGFSYYTGMIVEFRVAGSKQSIGGGGRYDKVVGKFLNRELPAVGISFGLERLFDLAQVEARSAAQVIVISLDQDHEALQLVKKLRAAGISTIMSNDKVGKALEYANAYTIGNAVFIGKDEVEKKKAKIKDLVSGNEKYVTEFQLIKQLAKKN